MIVDTVRRGYSAAAGGPPAGQVVFDTFTDPDDTPLASHTPDIDVVGGGWTDLVAPGHVISNNWARRLGDSTSVFIASIDSGLSDCIITATDCYFSRAGSGIVSSNLALRASNIDNYISAGVWSLPSGTWNWGIWEVINGSLGQSQTSPGLTSGNQNVFKDEVKVTCNGGQVRLEIPSENIDLTLNSSHNQAISTHGLRSYCTNSVAGTIYDDFSIESLS